MPDDVGDGFFHDPEDSHFDSGRQNGEVRFGAYRDSQCRIIPQTSVLGGLEVSTRLESGPPFPHGADQPEFVERWRA